MTRSRYFVRAADVPPYHPANHTGTVNRRLIGAENVGASQLEVVLGVSLATLCNFANNLGPPALNPQLAQYAWQPPVAAE